MYGAGRGAARSPLVGLWAGKPIPAFGHPSEGGDFARRIKSDHKDRPNTLPHQLRQDLPVLFIIVGLHIDVMQVHAAFFLGLKALNTLFN